MGPVDSGCPLPPDRTRPATPLPVATSMERPASSSSSGAGDEGAARSMEPAAGGGRRSGQRRRAKSAPPGLALGAGQLEIQAQAEPRLPTLGPAAPFNYPAPEEGVGRARRRRGCGRRVHPPSQACPSDIWDPTGRTGPKLGVGATTPNFPGGPERRAHSGGRYPLPPFPNAQLSAPRKPDPLPIRRHAGQAGSQRLAPSVSTDRAGRSGPQGSRAPFQGLKKGGSWGGKDVANPAHTACRVLTLSLQRADCPGACRSLAHLRCPWLALLGLHWPVQGPQGKTQTCVTPVGDTPVLTARTPGEHDTALKGTVLHAVQPEDGSGGHSGTKEPDVEGHLLRDFLSVKGTRTAYQSGGW